jgi:excisionase family DNA binding protein
MTDHLTIAEAAELSGRHRQTLYRLIADGTLEAHRDESWPGRNRRWLVDPESLKALPRGNVNRTHRAIRHGTPGGARTHRKRGEPVCADCLAAERAKTTLRRLPS